MTYIHATKNESALLHAKCGQPFDLKNGGIYISTWEWHDEDGCSDEGVNEFELYCTTCEEKVEFV